MYVNLTKIEIYCKILNKVFNNKNQNNVIPTPNTYTKYYSPYLKREQCFFFKIKNNIYTKIFLFLKIFL